MAGIRFNNKESIERFAKCWNLPVDKDKMDLKGVELIDGKPKEDKNA